MLFSKPLGSTAVMGDFEFIRCTVLKCTLTVLMCTFGFVDTTFLDVHNVLMCKLCLMSCHKEKFEKILQVTTRRSYAEGGLINGGVTLHLKRKIYFNFCFMQQHHNNKTNNFRINCKPL